MSLAHYACLGNDGHVAYRGTFGPDAAAFSKILVSTTSMASRREFKQTTVFRAGYATRQRLDPAAGMRVDSLVHRHTLKFEGGHRYTRVDSATPHYFRAADMEKLQLSPVMRSGAGQCLPSNPTRTKGVRVRELNDAKERVEAILNHSPDGTRSSIPLSAFSRPTLRSSGYWVMHQPTDYDGSLYDLIRWG